MKQLHCPYRGRTSSDTVAPAGATPQATAANGVGDGHVDFIPPPTAALVISELQRGLNPPPGAKGF